jgi:hypothetical protein
VLTKAGLRKIRFHELTFGSLLIQSGASIVYVKEQMGHSSIQVTVDINGHLIPGANVSFVDRLDEIPTQGRENNSATKCNPGATRFESATTNECSSTALLTFADMLCDVYSGSILSASEVGQFSANLGKPTFHA